MRTYSQWVVLLVFSRLAQFSPVAIGYFPGTHDVGVLVAYSQWVVTVQLPSSSRRWVGNFRWVADFLCFVSCCLYGLGATGEIRTIVLVFEYLRSVFLGLRFVRAAL